jgi:hopene-associated glycosyltransferase HpnB
LSGDFATIDRACDAASPSTFVESGNRTLDAGNESMIPSWIAAVSCLIWLYLIAVRGRFWRVALPKTPTTVSALEARVTVVIPARNEADVIAQTIQSVLEQNYTGPLHILVVDDQSSDGTANIVRAAAAQHPERVTLISSTSLPPGWTGKMWALSQGVQHASEFAPDYFLFTDADIVHAPDSVRSSVALAQADNRELVSMMVKLRCESLAERALIPAFVYFFFMLYPPERVNRASDKTAAAAGGDILVRADALARSGGIAAIRNELIDDCALAREIKRNGSVWLGLTENARSIRSYGSFAMIGRMISRNAFYQLRHSTWLLIGTVLSIAITYLAPPVLVFFGGWAAFFGGAAWLLMAITFLPMVRFYGLSSLWAPMLPLIGTFYAGATIHSAIQYWRRRGGEWKNRVQDFPPASDGNRSVSRKER